MAVVVLGIVYGNITPTVTPSDGRGTRTNEDIVLRTVLTSSSCVVLPFRDGSKVVEEENEVLDLDPVHGLVVREVVDQDQDRTRDRRIFRTGSTTP